MISPDAQNKNGVGSKVVDVVDVVKNINKNHAIT